LVARLSQARASSRSLSGAQALGSDVESIVWDPVAGPPAADALSGLDAVVHLAGEPLASGRWTAARKRAIVESREVGTRNLVQGLSELEQRPKVLVSASAIGFYGDRGSELLTEQSPRGGGFLSDVCEVWEREALAAERLGIRTVVMRTGIVLAKDGGALERMLPAFRMGVGGKLGSGEQYMSWVHIDDVVALFLEALVNEEFRGAVNVVSPNPVTNAVFTKALGRACGMPAIMPVPRLGLRVVFGEFADVLFQSQRVLPRVAESSGYRFRFPELDAALADCVSGR
jgi:hypothetical protein